MNDQSYVIQPVGRVESTLVDLADAPKQGDEGAPDAWIVIDPAFVAALDGLESGNEVFVLTWLDRAERSTLAVHPRDNPANPLRGVFSTRSADRPNPVGLHRAEIIAIDGNRVQVHGIEALDGTPVVDLKPTLGDDPR
jgi:tRNA-Thr(GGU) m(6)t(6)A37 methyltransferase TsaA